MGLATSVHELKTLVLSFHPIVVIETVEEERVERLLAEAARDLEMPLFEWSVTTGLRRKAAKRPRSERNANEGGRPQDVGQPILNTAEPLGLLGHLAGLTVEGIFLLKDLGRHLDDPTHVRKLRDVARRYSHTRSTLVLVGSKVELPPELEHQAVYLELRLPDLEELGQVANAVIKSLHAKRRVRVELSPEDTHDLLRALRGMTLNQARQAIAYAILEDGTLTARDISSVIDRKAKMIQESGLLEYFPVEDNAYELGGFTRLKAWLERAKVGFSAEAAKLGLTPPRGILIVGVQGCGKSLAAKAIARQWRQPLIKLDAGRLYDKYVGESEKNLRKATELAESMAPVTLWVDEIEKAFAPDGGASNDGGVSRRMLGALLTWLQEKTAEVFVVATANDVFALPPELLRKGRFDEIFFVDLPDSGERRTIFEIHLRQRRQDPAHFQLEDLALATEGFSGAEIEQAVIAGLYRALHEKQPLHTRHLLREIDDTVPLSVSRREDLERLRETARDRFVPVK